MRKNRPRLSPRTAIAIAKSTGDSSTRAMLEAAISSMRFSSIPNIGTSTAMQRNGRKLSDVFNRAVPCQSVVQVGHDSDVDARLTRLLDQPLYQDALARSGKKDLVHKMFARQFENFVYRSPAHRAVSATPSES